MQVVFRAGWGARAAKNQTPLSKTAQRGTAVHYSGADADEQADHKNCPGRVKSIQNFHITGRGWSDIAYSFLVCKHGVVFEGRGRGVRTAANGTNAGNDAYHAVCFLGDDSVGRDDVTDAGRQALAEAVDHCNAWARVTEVRPHSSFKATGCPGDELRAFIAQGLPVGPPAEEDDMFEAKDRQRLTDLETQVGAIHSALFKGHAINRAHPIDNLFEATTKTHQALVVKGTTTAEETVNLLFSRVRATAEQVTEDEAGTVPLAAAVAQDLAANGAFVEALAVAVANRIKPA